jgi:hypothetical protein
MELKEAFLTIASKRMPDYPTITTDPETLALIANAIEQDIGTNIYRGQQVRRGFSFGGIKFKSSAITESSIDATGWAELAFDGSYQPYVPPEQTAGSDSLAQMFARLQGGA